MIRKKFEEQPEYAEEWVDKLPEDFKPEGGRRNRRRT
jgi:hypothetical protein